MHLCVAWPQWVNHTGVETRIFVKNQANTRSANDITVYPKKYAHGFCFAVLCCGYTLTYFPISIRLTSLALWQSNDCPSASKAILMNMDKYFMWIHYEWLHNHNKAKHNKTVCIFLGIYCTMQWFRLSVAIVLTLWEKWLLIFHKEGFQLLEPSYCPKILENANVFMCFIKAIIA